MNRVKLFNIESKSTVKTLVTSNGLTSSARMEPNSTFAMSKVALPHAGLRRWKSLGIFLRDLFRRNTSYVYCHHLLSEISYASYGVFSVVHNILLRLVIVLSAGMYLTYSVMCNLDCCMTVFCPVHLDSRICTRHSFAVCCNLVLQFYRPFMQSLLSLDMHMQT